jgi:ubiquinone/menaquinone biosynthesis C-methylase UbiE
LFCGRANGLIALREMSFSRLCGCDLSLRLLRQSPGRFPLYLADCRELPFVNHSIDLLIVQGGLHHLPDLAEDLPKVLGEVHRVLKSDGRFVVVEPWRTPFLDFVPAVSRWSVTRRLYGGIDAFATMTAQESETYFRWLGSASLIEHEFQRWFRVEQRRVGLGKLNYIGIPSRN